MISDDVDLAIARLRAGGLVAIPTETVYGLAADARQPDAVARIFEVKGRPTNHPLIVHLAAADRIGDWATHIPTSAHLLAEAAWPGPLTMLLRRAAGVDDGVTGGRDTIGLRVPSHQMTLDVLCGLGSGVAAPSANRFGRVSPTSADHVLADIGGLLDPERDLILDGGPCDVGVESTIVDLTTTPPQVLRAGAITAETVQRLIGDVADASGPSRAAGMMIAHYAPRCTVELVSGRRAAGDRLDEHHAAGRRAGLLDRTDDLVVAAQRLYDDLRAADRTGLDALVVVMPPADGLGHALRDRLTKAAAGSGRASTNRPD